MTMKPQDIQKLVDAGATQSQAEAALTAIEDVNEAYEAFLCGVFDDVGENRPPKRTRNTTLHRQEAYRGNGTADAPLELDDECQDEEEEEDEEDEELDIVSSGTPEKSQPMSEAFDPYHGITFVKDQKEVIVDTIPCPKQWSLMGRNARGDKLEYMECTEVTSGEWMSGVPMGAEQSYFFEIYQKLTTQPALCPGCGHSYPRISGQFMATWPTLFAFLDHLERMLNYKCFSCGVPFCLACGQRSQSTSRTAINKSKAPEDNDTGGTNYARQGLMHCSVVNALIIGVGLIHLEGSRISTPHKESACTSGTATCTGIVDDPLDFEHSQLSIFESHDGCNCAFCLLTKSKPKTSEDESGGTGFAGSARDSYNWRSVQAAKQLAKDESIRKALELLRPYVPDPDRRRLVNTRGTVISADPAEHDYLPNIVTIAQLRRRFLPLASELLQNGSIADITDREPLFTELLKWFRLFGQHANLASLVAQPIMRLTKVSILEGKNQHKERVQEFVATYSPRALAENIVDQTSLLLRRLGNSPTSTVEQGNAPIVPSNAVQTSDTGSGSVSGSLSRKSKEEEDSDVHAEKVRAFCQSIVDGIAALDTALVTIKGQDFVDAMRASYGKSSSGAQVYVGDQEKQDPKRAVSRHQQIATYNEWAKGAIFDEAEMRVPGPSTPGSSRIPYCHSFDKEITASAKLQNSRRNLEIAKEIALFRSSLPAEWDHAIFVRVDSARIDVMKALIVGPPCSPYKNGLFAFDIFLPEDYKAVPPKVKIITTDGGCVRFGPNLYANGKVCLSLLGTWSGPGWTRESTVLQVLLSITSMVMGLEDPCVNEPGWEHHRGTEASRQYSKNLRRQTVRVAMKQMLEKPPVAWEDVIQQHFKLKRAAIEEQLAEWLKEDDNNKSVGDGTYLVRHNGASRDETASFKKDVAALKKLLAEL